MLLASSRLSPSVDRLLNDTMTVAFSDRPFIEADSIGLPPDV
jgi:hypothetical protein